MPPRMDKPPSDYRLLRHHSNDYPPADRLTVWKEIVARKLLKVEIEPLTLPFQIDATLRALAGLWIGSAVFGPSINRRTREIVEEDNDDIFVLINLEGELTVAHGEAELALGERDGCFLSCKQEGNFIRTTYGRVLCARFQRHLLALRVPGLDDAMGRVLRRDNEALRMLTSYLLALDDNQGLKSGALRETVTNQIYDLAAVVLNPISEQALVARERSVGARRLGVLKKFIAKNLARPELSLSDAAAACQLSFRQVQRLFEGEGTTFSQYLQGKRLARVYDALTDRRQVNRSIGEIALANGFSDISHFNRVFRRRYGAAPSEVRHGEVVAGRD